MVRAEELVSLSGDMQKQKPRQEDSEAWKRDVRLLWVTGTMTCSLWHPRKDFIMWGCLHGGHIGVASRSLAFSTLLKIPMDTVA